MAVYKIYPDKDTFIFTEDNLANAGLDEIIEIGGYSVLGVGQASRGLIKFSTTEIQDVINNKVSGSYQANLKLFLADAYETPVSHSIYVYPVYEHWDQGIGKFGDIPQDSSGTSWRYTKSSQTNPWDIPANAALPTGVTASYNTTYPGGGNWYTGSNGTSLAFSQSFEAKSNLDINIDITPAVTLHYTGSIANNGFIIKLEDALEFSTTRVLRHKYFSSDTNTIYPPELEFKWNDTDYQSTGTLLDTTEAVVQVSNNLGEYKDDGKYRFRLHARPRFPTRQFSTTSIYKTNYRLPQASYYAIKDEFTEQLVVDFDTTYTAISNDSNGPYFDLYMNSLQPERFYRILIKTEIDGNTVTLSDKSTFKVVRNV